MDAIIITTLEESLLIPREYLTPVVGSFSRVFKTVNKHLEGVQACYIILAALLGYHILLKMTTFAQSVIRNATIGNLIRIGRGLPILRGLYEAKLSKITQQVKQDLVKIYHGEPFVCSLPKEGFSGESLYKRLEHYQHFDSPFWLNGRISGAVYTNNTKAYNELLAKVYSSNMWSNPLHSDVFACVRKMEAEIVRMVATMYEGNPEQVLGSVTSGGTESIIMACKAYRDYALKVRGISGKAEIVAPVTVHAAFEKAANMLNCKIVHIPVDKTTYKVDLRKMESAINQNTCMLVGSAPQFPHGIVDPIAKIAKLGVRYDVPVHVDACLGGFLIPFMADAGYPLDEKFNFTVQGVTSVSADTHKYGYAPKGTSVVLYSDRKYIHQQYSIQTDWPGGVYASPTLPGSRPGGLIATCWIAMMYNGRNGYIEATRKIITTARHIARELAQIDGIRLLGEPKVSVIALTSDCFNIYKLNDKLTARGWNLNALQFPSAIHLCVTQMHANDHVAKSFIQDVSEAARGLMAELKADGDGSANGKKNTVAADSGGSAAIYGMAQTIADRSIVADICTHYLDGCLGY